MQRVGIDTGDRLAWRLCSQHTLGPTNVRNSRTAKRAGGRVNDDLLRRHFTAAGLNRTSVTDLHEDLTAGVKANCYAIKELFPNRIPQYAASARMTAILITADLVGAVLRTGLARREPDGVISSLADGESVPYERNFQAMLKRADHQGVMGLLA